MIDRVTASRLGIAPTTIDNTLYDAFGQRQINTMYTQVNQYHVVLEVEPYFKMDPEKLNQIYILANASSGASGAGASTSFAASGSSSAGSNALTSSAKYTPGRILWRRLRTRFPGKPAAPGRGPLDQAVQPSQTRCH